MLIYLIKNLINNKVYIGQTIRGIEQRWKEHVSGKKECQYFQYAIEKHKPENFDKQVICYANSLQELNILEEFWINFYNSRDRNVGYNIAKGGFNTQHSDETKKKISDSNKGRIMSDEQKQHLSNIFTGVNNHTPASLEKIRQANLGNTHSRGRKLTEEHKAKMSLATKGKQISAERIEKMHYYPPLKNKQYKGIYYSKEQNLYKAKIYHNGKTIYLGGFKTENEAAIAYNMAVDLYWGGKGWKNPV